MFLKNEENSVPDVLNIKNQDWELNVWVKDNSSRLQVLQKTMEGRGRSVPPSKLYLSPPSLTAITLPINDSSENLVPSSELVLPEPIFFENKEYFFEFSFNDLSRFFGEPRIEHRLVAIEDSFHFSKKSNTLHGSINFGNDVGWFRLTLRYKTEDGQEQRQTLSFEVLPTKMAMDTDLAAIHQAIDAAYPLWRFSFAQKTEQDLARSHQKHERFALLWLAHFKQLRSRLEDAVKLVIRAPHARLLPQQRAMKLERLRGRLTPKLEVQVNEHIQQNETHHRYQISSRRLSVDTPENRFVKMVLKRCSSELSSITKLALLNQKAPEEGGKLSASFFEELASWKKPLDQLLNQPFFTEIGHYEGLERESLVLHQRAGYANIYRLWQELKMYLGLFGQNAAVSMKSVADLYEVWCFLQIKNMLEELGFTEVTSSKASLINTALEKSMVNGSTSAFLLHRECDNLNIRLSHEPNFSSKKERTAGGIYSWTTTQIPDIFLEATFENGKTMRWIFDAKYRIWENEGKDLAPDDAINQMHRYRDALIHIDKTGEGWKEKSRPVLGAFVLYPGWFDENQTDNPYNNSIEDVGIGAFPLLPERPNIWLRQFLEKQFGNTKSASPYLRPESDRYLVEDSARIAVTGTYLSQYHDLALVACVAPSKGREKSYLDKFNNGTAPWYHVPVSTTDSKKRSISRHVMKESRFCALASYDSSQSQREVKFVYDVVSIEIKKRCDLSIEQSGSLSESTDDYWLIKLGTSRPIKKPITTKNVRSFKIFHTSEKDLMNSKNWDELPHHYRSLV